MFIMSMYMFTYNMISWILAVNLFLNNLKFIIEWNLVNINSFKMIFIMYFDWMSLMFFSTVLMISSLVILYSMSYMKMDTSIKRFMMLIMIFVLSMMLMIISPNMISILLGWDGLGLSSYCLVCYYMNKKSFNSSMITILMNRIGDILILMLIGLFLKFGSWNFILMNKLNLMFMIFIMIAAITKSAQIPFSMWLPMAMAAPTPISSLVHSSTLVTAGVYLMIRFNSLFNKNFLFIMMILSCMTMLMASTSANGEFDLKKIIALSTLSQLGLMIFTISLNLPKLSFFHLTTHAMFKSLLFLCSGIMIHNYFNHQDIRFMSFMNLNIPFINMIFNISSLTLCGMPFLSGFYSKDLIIEMFIMNKFNWLMFLMMYMSMGLTTSYTFRLIFYISLKNLKIYKYNLYNSFNLMNYSIILLLFMSMFYGSTINWIIFSSLNTIFIPFNLKIFIWIIIIMNIIIGLMIPILKYKIYNFKFMKFMFMYFNFMWFLNNMYKNNKILNFNNKLIFFSESWLELMSSKMFLYKMKTMYKYKIFNLNFFNMILLMMYLNLMIFMM
uniref:NADH-ubiquinone oxidoreductase chain 5 n=1 Tax=Psyttalia humilis TaxID=566040 RepID=A0A8A4JBJ0_9HYME|nr:NADH dehydrogenase subunit 5 [Psyttalia humilis]